MLIFTVYYLHLGNRILFQLSSLRRAMYTLRGRWQGNIFKMATIMLASTKIKIMLIQQLTSTIQIVEYGRITLNLILVNVYIHLYYEISNASVMKSSRPRCDTGSSEFTVTHTSNWKQEKPGMYNY
jgi:hypothetical protein